LKISAKYFYCFKNYSFTIFYSVFQNYAEKWTVTSSVQCSTSLNSLPQSALEKKSSFTRVSRHLRQTPSDLRQELLSTGTHGAKSFQGHWKKVVGPAERAVFVCLPSSRNCGTVYLFIYTASATSHRLTLTYDANVKNTFQVFNLFQTVVYS